MKKIRERDLLSEMGLRLELHDDHYVSTHSP